MAIILAETLHRYAKRHYDRTGNYVTFRQAAKRFRCSLADIEQSAEDAKDHGLGIDILVAMGIPMVGYGPDKPRGEWEIEVYDNG